MAEGNSTTKQSGSPQTVKFSVLEYDTLTLNIPRALALADVMTIADQCGDTERCDMGQCVSMLYELLLPICMAWEEATSRQVKA